MAGDNFKNVFAVADDDQIIYQWAGASYRQIVAFRENFKPEQIQLVENRRCPPEVVRAANSLVSHNADRTPNKQPLVPVKPESGPCISQHVYATDAEEAEGRVSCLHGLCSIEIGKSSHLVSYPRWVSPFRISSQELL